MGLLPNISQNRYSLFKTVAIYLSFMCYATSLVVPGVALLDLEIRIQEPFAATSRIISAHLIGYFIGSFIVGIFGKHVSIYLVLALSSIAAGLLTIITPWFYEFIWMALSMFIMGIFHSCFELECNICLFEIWGEKVCNFIQLLHVNYGIGALITPTVVRNYLLPIPDDMGEDWDRSRAFYSPDDVQIQWPFMMSGCACVVTGLVFVYFYFNEKPREETEKSVDQEKSEHPTWKVYIAVLWVCLIAHTGFSIETIFCVFGQAFGVKSALKMDKKVAALLTTVFWTAFTVSRVLFVVVAVLIAEKIMVWICLVCLIFSSILFLTCATYSTVFLFIASALLGLGSSPLFGVAFSSLEKYFHLSERQTSIIFLCGTISCAIHAPLVGYLMDVNPQIFAYFLVSLSFILVIVVILFPVICNKLFGKPFDQMDRLKVRLPHGTRLGSIALSSRRSSIVSVGSRKTEITSVSTTP